MADIPSARSKINDLEVSADAPVTEQLLNKMGADVNDYLDKDLRFQEFLASGSFTAPDNVSQVYVEMIGGGGGGQGGGTSYGGGGGSGGTIWNGFVQVTEGNVYSITCGTAGSAGAGSAAAIGSAGGNGGATTAFGITCDGGLGGGQEVDPGTGVAIAGGSFTGVYYGRGYRSKGGNGKAGSGLGNAGENNNYALGSIVGDSSVTFATGGSGGAGLANGGSGNGNLSGGLAGTKGSGGGGGVGTSPAGGPGYAGGVGYVRIFWYGNA